MTTLILFLTSLANAYVSSPAWLAVIEQVPWLTGVKVEPETVQIDGVVLAKLTVNPLVEVALNCKVPVDREIEVGGVKVMV